MKPYSLEDAIELAHMLRSHPWPKSGEPPSVAEALAIVKEAQHGLNHTWITGETARRLLEEALPKSKRKTKRVGR